MSLKETLGAASRSAASLAWNSSRYSSGTRPTSRKLITWPSFIAAPFMVPRAATICSAVSTWRLARARSAASSERATLAARVAACLVPWVAASRPMRAARDQRDVGIRSLAIELAALDLRAGDDVVAPVGPAHPRLVPAVVVVAEQDQRGRLAQRAARFVALGVQAAPHADEGVGLPFAGDGRGLGVPGPQDRLRRQAHEHVHDRVAQVGVGRAARRAD